MTAKKLLRFLPALIWMAVIFYFSSQSTTGVPGTRLERFLILKFFHLAEYAVLFLLLFFGFGRRLPAALASYFFALSDEFHQSLVPGREARFRDTLFDLAGIFIGMAALKLIISIKNKNNSKPNVKTQNQHY